MATITVDLAAAGLTHAKGKSDKCAGEHDIGWVSVTSWENDELVIAGDLDPVLQALHEQAHPDGTARWEYCRERGCTDAAELL